MYSPGASCSDSRNKTDENVLKHTPEQTHAGTDRRRTAKRNPLQMTETDDQIFNGQGLLDHNVLCLKHGNTIVNGTSTAVTMHYVKKHHPRYVSLHIMQGTSPLTSILSRNEVSLSWHESFSAIGGKYLLLTDRI